MQTPSGLGCRKTFHSTDGAKLLPGRRFARNAGEVEAKPSSRSFAARRSRRRMEQKPSPLPRTPQGAPLDRGKQRPPGGWQSRRRRSAERLGEGRGSSRNRTLTSKGLVPNHGAVDGQPSAVGQSSMLKGAVFQACLQVLGSVGWNRSRKRQDLATGGQLTARFSGRTSRVPFTQDFRTPSGGCRAVDAYAQA